MMGPGLILGMKYWCSIDWVCDGVPLQAFKEQELPGDIAKRIKQQEEKILQQRQELEKLRMDTKQVQEEWQRRREQEQKELFQRQREELERLKEKLKEMEMRRENSPATQAQQQQVQTKLLALSIIGSQRA